MELPDTLHKLWFSSKYFVQLSLSLILNIYLGAFLLCGQNLVPNGDFEDYTNCPDAPGQYVYATPWFTVGPGSPDYYNACSTSDRVGVPHNKRGGLPTYQPARSGQAYMGIVTYDVSIGGERIVEYLGVELTEAMVAGESYAIEWYVAPFLSANSYPFGFDFSDGIGMLLVADTAGLATAQDVKLNAEESVPNLSGVITDTLGWTKISGCYQAKGGERFALIGNFRPSEEVTVLESDESICCPQINHIIEDVSIVQIEDLSPEVTLCGQEASELIIPLPYPDWEVRSSVGNGGDTVVFDEEGIYVVSRGDEYCVLQDTITVRRFEPDFMMEVDTIGCTTQPLRLGVPVGLDVLWSTGSILDTIVVDEGGSYFAEVTLEDCGSSTYTTFVDLIECECPIEFPTAFSPNGDGINDVFTGNMSCEAEVETLSFLVFDRWGNLIHSLNSEPGLPHWDGRIAEQLASSGVYVYLAKMSVYSEQLQNESIVMKTGDINLVRLGG